MRLIGVELNRYFSRWAIRGGLAIAIILLGALTLNAFISTQPLSAQQIQAAEGFLAEDLKAWEEFGDEWVAECLEYEAQQREATGDAAFYGGCDDLEPKLSNYLWDESAADELRGEMFATTLLILLVLTIAVSITFIAAEFTTGTVSTWLTFEPRRLRVYASKAAALAIATALIVAVSLFAIWGAAKAISAYRGLEPEAVLYTIAMNDVSLLGVLARGVIACVMVALISQAIATLFRHTAGAYIVTTGVVIIDYMLRGMMPEFSKFSVTAHLESIVLKGTDYWIDSCQPISGGMECASYTKLISFETSLVVYAALTVVFMVLGAWQFKRRDIA